MEFEEFAEKFRERTAKRLLEFESKLEQAQQELEKQTEQQAQKQTAQSASESGQQAAEPQQQRGASVRPAHARSAGVSQLRDISRASRPRQVKSVLRRGPD